MFNHYVVLGMWEVWVGLLLSLRRVHLDSVAACVAKVCDAEAEAPTEGDLGNFLAWFKDIGFWDLRVLEALNKF